MELDMARLGLIPLLVLALATSPGAAYSTTPPPPSGPVSASFDEIQELSIFEGEWGGLGIYSSASNTLENSASLRIYRPASRDFFVAEFMDDGELREYFLITYSAGDRSYEIYYPGYVGAYSDNIDRRTSTAAFSNSRMLAWKYPRQDPSGWQSYELIKVTDDLITLTISNISSQGLVTSTEVYTLSANR